MQHILNLAVPSGVQQVLGCFLSVLCALKHDHMARKKSARKDVLCALARRQSFYPPQQCKNTSFPAAGRAAAACLTER